MKELKEYIRNIPDFPEKGIIFRDVTSILQDADGLKLAIDELAKKLEGVDFDVIAGAESRGFLFGMPLSYLLHKPFVPIRKKGKLPCETVSKTYDLEYGTATIEIHKDAIKKGDKVRIIDGELVGVVAYVQRIQGKKAIIGDEIRNICGATIEIDKDFLEFLKSSSLVTYLKNINKITWH